MTILLREMVIQIIIERYVYILKYFLTVRCYVTLNFAVSFSRETGAQTIDTIIKIVGQSANTLEVKKSSKTFFYRCRESYYTLHIKL